MEAAFIRNAYPGEYVRRILMKCQRVAEAFFCGRKDLRVHHGEVMRDLEKNRYP